MRLLCKFHHRDNASHPDENISLKSLAQKFSEIFGDLQRFSDILLKISQLFAKHLCNFIHTYRERTISSLKSTDFLV